jgi:tetratricopeptide (TPR) repeat protein
LNDLGMVRFNQECYSESTELFRESLRLFQSLVGEEHWALVVPSGNLALSYLKLGQVNDADLILQRAIPLYRNTLGENHPTCGALLEDHATVLRKLGRKQEAKELTRRSQEIVRAFRRHNGIGSTVNVATLRLDGN